MDILSLLRGRQAPAMDSTMKDVLAKNPQALPSEVYASLHGSRDKDINLPESPMAAASRRLKTIIDSLTK